MTTPARILMVLLISVCVAGWSPARASGLTVPGLSLHVAPIVDVGGNATFSLTARKWPSTATVSLRFLSPHHGFSGTMLWDVTCHCYRLAVSLAKRVHPLEHGTAWADVRVGANSQVVSTGFQIRGLAAGGKTYSPGGRMYLTSWVSDRQPFVHEWQHFCAWMHASDAFPERGVRVHFIVHYKTGSLTINGGRTGADGVTCKHVKIPTVPAGVAVPVDTRAGSLHMRVSFTPR